jgi:hypothetical protein
MAIEALLNVRSLGIDACENILPYIELKAYNYFYFIYLFILYFPYYLGACR